MNKTNIVYRHVAEKVLANRKARLVVRGIAKELGISPDTVSNAIAPLRRIGAVSMYSRHFEVVAFKKLLVYWAVNRKFERDIVYATYVPIKGIEEIENYMPDEIAFTNFSGYCKNFPNDAADYGEVHVYAGEDSTSEIKRRFPKNTNAPRSGAYNNLIILKPDGVLEEKIEKHTIVNSSVSLPQLYVDLWNNSSWMAYEFIKKLEEKIDGIYEKAILE
jgi:predicted DNA-binding transcriptional regulator